MTKETCLDKHNKKDFTKKPFSSNDRYSHDDIQQMSSLVKQLTAQSFEMCIEKLLIESLKMIKDLRKQIKELSMIFVISTVHVAHDQNSREISNASRSTVPDRTTQQNEDIFRAFYITFDKTAHFCRYTYNLNRPSLNEADHIIEQFDIILNHIDTATDNTKDSEKKVDLENIKKTICEAKKKTQQKIEPCKRVITEIESFFSEEGAQAQRHAPMSRDMQRTFNEIASFFRQNDQAQASTTTSVNNPRM